MNNFWYRCTSRFLALKYCGEFFFWKLSAIYTKWGAQTFPPILGVFAIIEHNFGKIVAPPSHENENCVVHLKGQSLLQKKTVNALSKSTHKPRRNTWSNCAPVERRTCQPRSMTNKTRNKASSRHRGQCIPAGYNVSLPRAELILLSQ